MNATTTRHVRWTDVSPRDGLQNIADPVATDVKVRLIRGLLDAGVPCVEATSFVSPRWVPQMGDAAAVLEQFDDDDRMRLRVLVPNLQGLQRALDCGIANVLFTVGATDTFNLRNVNRPVEQSLVELAQIVDVASRGQCAVDVALSVAFGCPFEGRVEHDRVAALIRRLRDLGAEEIGIADTIGVATPADVREMCALLASDLPTTTLSLHLHDTRGLGVANVMAGFEAGVDRFDGSAGGLGGCPFAPRSTGNVCSEDALAALASVGATIDADLGKYCEVAERLASDLGRELPGKLYRAGLWPAPAAALAKGEK